MPRKKHNKSAVKTPNIPTGITMLDLACSDSILGGFLNGKIINIIGDSSAGKSFLALNCLASIIQNPMFSSMKKIYDDVEAADEFDMSHLFGDMARDNIQPPACDAANIPLHSNTIEDFELYFHVAVADAKATGNSFIYVLDSFDALTSDTELVLMESNLKARAKGNKEKASYGMQKAKFTSTFFRQVKAELKQTNSCLLIISQTREDINPLTFTTKKRTGGKALDFYSSLVIWLAVKKKLKNAKHNLQIGVHTIAKISKNKQTGKIRQAMFPIFYDYGIDDIASMIDWLLEHKFWTGTRKMINTGEDFGKLSYVNLIALIETESAEQKLRGIVQEGWSDIEEDLKISRKRKFK